MNDQDRISAAWAASYLDPMRAIALGRTVAEADGELAAEGWLHVALGEVRVGDPKLALQALEQARRRFGPAGNLRGLALCDEVKAIQLRRLGDHNSAMRLLADIDARGDLGYTASDRYLALNSRAITHKALGQVDEALRDFYAALETAQACGLLGQRITALTNLGGYHKDLHNLESARSYSEEALSAARDARAPVCIAAAAVNLIHTYHACGQFGEARAVAAYLLDYEGELLPGTLRQHQLPLALAHLGVGELDAAQQYLDRSAPNALGQCDNLVLWSWLQARCLLLRSNATRARLLAERALSDKPSWQAGNADFETLQLLHVCADACEALGDTAAALAWLRRANQVFEGLVSRSARARSTALQASYELAQAQRERDIARDSHRSVEDDRRRLVQLNQALQAQVQETEMLHLRLREQALRDPLTGLHNRRYLFEMAPGLLDLARRQAAPLCVVLIDLDHFKLLNDTYGHHAGDAVLQRFASLLAQMLRRSDVVCRHGGEEFVAVMPDIDADGAQTMLTRLLQAYQGQQQDVGRRKLPSCSFSAGIAVFPTHGSSLEQLLSRADRALYSAKARGRARIEKMPMTDFGTFS